MLPKYTAWAPRYVLSRRKDPDIQTERSLGLPGRSSSKTAAVGRSSETFAAEALQSGYGEGVPVLDSPIYPRQRVTAPSRTCRGSVGAVFCRCRPLFGKFTAGAAADSSSVLSFRTPLSHQSRLCCGCAGRGRGLRRSYMCESYCTFADVAAYAARLSLAGCWFAGRAFRRSYGCPWRRCGRFRRCDDVRWLSVVAMTHTKTAARRPPFLDADFVFDVPSPANGRGKPSKRSVGARDHCTTNTTAVRGGRVKRPVAAS